MGRNLSIWVLLTNLAIGFVLANSIIENIEQDYMIHFPSVFHYVTCWAIVLFCFGMCVIYAWFKIIIYVSFQFYRMALNGLDSQLEFKLETCLSIQSFSLRLSQSLFVNQILRLRHYDTDKCLHEDTLLSYIHDPSQSYTQQKAKYRS